MKYLRTIRIAEDFEGFEIVCWDSDKGSYTHMRVYCTTELTIAKDMIGKALKLIENDGEQNEN